MAEAFFTHTRGCVYTYQVGESGGRGFYSFDPPLPEPGRILLNGGDLDDGDIVSPVVTLDYDKILYTFGPDWGKSTVSGVVLLGEASGQGDVMNGLRNWFTQNRSIKRAEPLRLSGPGQMAFNVFVTRLLTPTPDPEIHVQPFVFQVLVVDS